MSALRLLVVEDSVSLQEFYRELLEDPRLNGRFEETIAGSAEAAMRSLRSGSPDIVILDWILPGRDGMTVLDAIRADSRTRAARVFVVTCLSSKAREAQAIRSGADDYLAKPFDREVLVSRLLSLARRLEPSEAPEETIRLAELELEMPLGRLWIGDRRVELYHREADLLRIFLKRRNTLHSAEYLWSVVWGYPSADFKETLGLAVDGLREKLGEEWGPRLDAIKGEGYVLYDPE
jgi:DNA-binding response OmpR family regulator